MNSATSTDPGLRPWQLFLLAGMLAATGVVLVSKGQTLPGVVVLSLTVVASSLVAVAGYRSLAPLVAVRTTDLDLDGPVAGRARAALEREKALVLRAIKELEFDHAMGKTGAADFEEMRGRLMRRAVGLMRELEGADFRSAIERDLAARVPDAPARASAHAAAPAAPARVSPAAGPAVPPAATAAPPATEPAPPVAAAASTLARLCGACQGVNDVDARFCKHCGAALVEPPA
jgi:hypothetical protein